MPPTEGGAIARLHLDVREVAGPGARGHGAAADVRPRRGRLDPRCRTTELVAAARADAERTLRITGEPLLVRVSRWERAMPRYTVGHLRRVAAIEAAVAAWPAVTVAGASYRGVGLPDCVTQGQAAAARLLDRVSGNGASVPTAPVSASELPAA